MAEVYVIKPTEKHPKRHNCALGSCQCDFWQRTVVKLPGERGCITHIILQLPLCFSRHNVYFSPQRHHKSIICRWRPFLHMRKCELLNYGVWIDKLVSVRSCKNGLTWPKLWWCTHAINKIALGRHTIDVVWCICAPIFCACYQLHTDDMETSVVMLYVRSNLF